MATAKYRSPLAHGGALGNFDLLFIHLLHSDLVFTIFLSVSRRTEATDAAWLPKGNPQLSPGSAEFTRP